MKTSVLIFLCVLGLSAQAQAPQLHIRIDRMLASGVQKELPERRDFIMRNDSIFAQLPFWGQSQNSSYGSQSGGIVLGGSIQKYEVVKSKKGSSFRFESAFQGEIFQIRVECFDKESAYISIQSSRRSQAQYMGSIQAD